VLLRGGGRGERGVGIKKFLLKGRGIKGNRATEHVAIVGVARGDVSRVDVAK
jgi:hypothetical protein